MAPEWFPGSLHLWRSADGGTKWTAVDTGALRSNPGDASLTVVDNSTLYVTSLTFAGTVAYASHDAGASWTKSPLAGPFGSPDREWTAVDGAGHVFLVATDVPADSGGWVSRSDDGGTTWRPMGPSWNRALWGAGVNGPLVFDAARSVLRLVHLCHDYTAVCVSSSTDGAASWTTVLVSDRRANAFNVVPSLAADRNGTLYASWADATSGEVDVWLSTSTDGMTWAAPQTISSNGTNVMPWVATSRDGRVGVAWYATDRAGDNNDVAAMRGASWHVAYAAIGSGGSVGRVQQAADDVHTGSLSTAAAAGNPTTGPDRSLGDFLTLVFDGRGHAVIAYVAGGLEDGGATRLMLGRQA